MTRTLKTYLGRDAGQRVLSGRIVRGIAERIDAVVWFSDLRGFTRITDTAPEQVIPLLNDCSDVIVSAIHEQVWVPIANYVPYTALQNITGQPAISLPLACSKSGLPIGVQFVGRFGEEHLLLQLAAQIEEAEPWNKTRPLVYG
jgi:Asp-tRNA(Asn)/Glu-tRNA(Gln) amidotransferase A subunit family amidase